MVGRRRRGEHVLLLASFDSNLMKQVAVGGTAWGLIAVADAVGRLAVLSADVVTGRW